MTRIICIAILLTLALIVLPVAAQPTCPGPNSFVFTPQQPSPGDMIDFRLASMAAHGATSGAIPLWEIEGTTIDARMWLGSGGGVGVPPIPWREFGPLPAGDYQVRIATRITNNNFDCPVVTLPLRVGAGTPPPAVAAPVSSPPMMVLLILVLGGVGWVALRRG